MPTAAAKPKENAKATTKAPKTASAPGPNPPASVPAPSKPSIDDRQEAAEAKLESESGQDCRKNKWRGRKPNESMFSSEKTRSMTTPKD
ncbi:hypothetical protein ACHAW5_007738 [Stephanodiscus triporus]|uniref:Uncharacterized protein n=1 Tax=Stephanodiscus triporus TaxID=2934178 RepID=A0ABD3N482_9STRA